MTEETKFYTVRQCAEILGGISERCVRDMIKNKQLPGKRLGNRFFVPRSFFEEKVKDEKKE